MPGPDQRHRNRPSSNVQALAQNQGLNIAFQTASADDTQAPNQALDVVTANKCFLYFDTQSVVENLLRWLKPTGSFVISHFSWLPDVDPIARASEELILQHNPNWQGAGYHGATRPSYPGLSPSMHYCGYFYYDEAIAFNRQS